MSHRIKMQVPDHVYDWLVAESKRADVPMAGLVRLALVRAYRTLSFDADDASTRIDPIEKMAPHDGPCSEIADSLAG